MTSWFISPLVAALLAVAIYLPTKAFVLHAQNPFERGLALIPLYAAVTVMIVAFFMIYDGAPGLRLDKTPLEVAAGLAVAVGVVLALLAQMVLVPLMRRHFELVEQLDEANVKHGQASRLENEASVSYHESSRAEEQGKDAEADGCEEEEVVVDVHLEIVGAGGRGGALKVREPKALTRAEAEAGTSQAEASQRKQGECVVCGCAYTGPPVKKVSSTAAEDSGYTGYLR